jgi:hypothetical protein
MRPNAADKETRESDAAAIEVSDSQGLANHLIALHGRRAPQHIVDLMQRAIRASNDAQAFELERTLRLVEDRLAEQK